jgi:hypothetical protein
MGAWAYHELDPSGAYHQRSRPAVCDCGAAAWESECADVGGHWVFCLACGVVDAGGPDREAWDTGPVDEDAAHPLWDA